MKMHLFEPIFLPLVNVNRLIDFFETAKQQILNSNNKCCIQFKYALVEILVLMLDVQFLDLG